LCARGFLVPLLAGRRVAAMLITSSSTPKSRGRRLGFAFLKPNQDRRGADLLPPNAGTGCVASGPMPSRKGRRPRSRQLREPARPAALELSPARTGRRSAVGRGREHASLRGRSDRRDQRPRGRAGTETAPLGARRRLRGARPARPHRELVLDHRPDVSAARRAARHRDSSGHAEPGPATPPGDGGQLRRWPGVAPFRGTMAEARYRMVLWIRSITSTGRP
jgi:hypothetical protein